MYRTNEIRSLHMEVTSLCNARCPMCLRSVCGGKINPQLPLTELSLKEIQSIFPESFIRGLQRMYMCGNYGDPVAASETLEIFSYFRELNPNIHLEMFTNGSARPAAWWKKLAPILSSCRFSVDGLEDTNHLYRRGTHWPTILRNMKAFIEAGGKARWDYIVFKHNEHQVEEARRLSEELGFVHFQVKKTGRFFSNTRSQGKDSQAVLDKNGETEYYLEKPQAPEYQNSALEKEAKIADQWGSMENYLDQTGISCRVAKEKSLYVSAEGHIFPCCWTANQLYPWYFQPQKSQIWSLVDQLPEGLESLNGKTHSLQSIVEGPFFNEILPAAWSCSSVKAGKPKVCAKTCGSDFDPFSAQFQNPKKA